MKQLKIYLYTTHFFYFKKKIVLSILQAFRNIHFLPHFY